MITVNIHEAKTHLSRLLKRVSMGEEVIIAKAGKPLARIVRLAEKPQKRTPGQDRGTFKVPEDFDAPLPEDVRKQFES
jgi:prevent-host-death family protein